MKSPHRITKRKTLTLYPKPHDALRWLLKNLKKFPDLSKAEFGCSVEQITCHGNGSTGILWLGSKKLTCRQWIEGVLRHDDWLRLARVSSDIEGKRRITKRCKVKIIEI